MEQHSPVSLSEMLQRCGLGHTSQIHDSTDRTFPPFSIQLHGITDAPYFAGSTRVRIFLGHPSLRRVDASSQSDDDDHSDFVEIFSALHPDGGQHAQGMAEESLPILDTTQADAAECCAPWFAGAGSFAYVDANVMCDPQIPIRESIVAVALIDVIDRRTNKSIGCIGGCVLHLMGRNGVASYPIRREVQCAVVESSSERYATGLLRVGGNSLPLTSLVVELHWGPDCSSHPNTVTSKKLRTMMFGAIPVEQQVRVAPCLNSSASVSQEDRRRLLYKNATFRSVRPVDMQLTAEIAKCEFDRVDAAEIATGSSLGIHVARWDTVESLGFLVFNLRRGATLTLHRIEDIEPIPCHGVGRAGLGNSSAVLAPSPSLANLMIFRIVVEGNGVVVGQTLHHDWDASLLRPSFPASSSTFLFCEDTMMDDYDDGEDDTTAGVRSSGSIQASTSSGTFGDLGELQGVTALVRVFVMVPNYKKLSATAAAAVAPKQATANASSSTTTTGGGGRNSSAAASLLSRFGFEHFEPMNPSHYQVVPYAWGVVDMVAPNQPFIKCKQNDRLTLYRGKPTQEIMQALEPLILPKKTGGGGPVAQKGLQDIMDKLRREKLLPAQAMQTHIAFSVDDAAMIQNHYNSVGNVTGVDPSPSSIDDGRVVPNGLMTLRRAWLGLGKEITIPQVEECLEATFRASVFQ